jgi:hypothetical protein
LLLSDPRKLLGNLHPRLVDDFSTAAYMINRRHAEKLMSLHVRDDKYKLDNGVRPRAVADDLIYNSGNTYSVPLLFYKLELGSSAPRAYQSFHRASHDGIFNFWYQSGSQISIDQVTGLRSIFWVSY